MNIFITGAEGFVGRNLIQYLIDNTSYNIFTCDNGNFSIAMSSDKSNRAVKVCHDISDIKLSDLSKIDVLIHLAAVKKHNSSREKENELLRTNFIETRRLFNLIADSNIKQVIFSSSLYATGNFHKLHFAESDLPIPSTLYGASKFFGECCMRELESIKRISLTAFRLYFIYGPHQHYGKGYPSVFISTLNALNNNKNPIINDGKQKLDYLFVDDLSELILKSIENPIDGFSIFNASSSHAYEVEYIVNRLTYLWNQRHGTNFIPIYQGEDFTKGTYRSGSNELVSKTFDWSPKISIDQGLEAVFDWYIKSYYANLSFV